MKNQTLSLKVGNQLGQRGCVDFEIWLIGDGPLRSMCEHLAILEAFAVQTPVLALAVWGFSKCTLQDLAAPASGQVPGK